jgi:hypothetical protein
MQMLSEFLGKQFAKQREAWGVRGVLEIPATSPRTIETHVF